MDSTCGGRRSGGSGLYRLGALGGGFIPEGVQAFAEHVRGRMVMPIDLSPDELQGLITKIDLIDYLATRTDAAA